MQAHATAISFSDTAILLRGPAGCGKSDLALRLLDLGNGLIADDRCDIDPETSLVSCPDEIHGLLEIRGVGILKVMPAAPRPLVLVIDLVESGAVERMPEPQTCNDYGKPVPLFQLAPFEASACHKVIVMHRVATNELRISP